ncbi:PREDICTED: peptide methionine sulfoxide reductase-like [Priapulus caudatus]|uniref:peptide-methionine (S)-S-oxide reductase n=1 Tax=Priapulus caudatus TaxID=37621 RepID=A0ABM1F2P5_PRICU|nr:PREDICTED: peptide methionine sulfoxide reductase-like [Priapulus caudatus]
MLKVFWQLARPHHNFSRQYMSGIWYHNEAQKRAAKASLTMQQKSSARPIVLGIHSAGKFYQAEHYHQKFLLKRHRSLVELLAMHEEELVTSPIATRLTGYVHGFGNRGTFMNEAKMMNLSEDIKDYILEERGW